MTKPDKFYITTAIVYPNADPHIGFALELLQADVIARFNRLLGNDVFFLTGTDDHGIKNQRKAESEGLKPREYIQKMLPKFKNLIKKLNISNDFFISTSDKEIHYPTAQDIWKKLVKNGDIYKKKYKGLYCVGCESFKTEKDLVDGKCSYHTSKKIEEVEEENYFFKLSKYTEKLKKIIEENEYKILPESRKNEILSVINNGLKDVSFSRPLSSLKWGVPVPNDSEQTMYVWCDALTNYLSGIGYTSDKKKFKKYWSVANHIIGKDILRFHAALWPAMLLSAGIDLPKSLFVHGFINDAKGKKMSKSLGNVIDPIEQIKKYGTDQLRYFLIREIPSNSDGNYSEDSIKERINNELANDLGNLLNRVLVMTEKYFDSKIPKGEVDKKFKKEIENILKNTTKHIENFKLNEGLKEVWKLVKEGNKYIANKKPWEVKDEKKLSDIIYTLLELMRCISILIYPFIPETSIKIMKQLGLKEKDISFKNLKLGLLKLGNKIKKENILFKKIE